MADETSTATRPSRLLLARTSLARFRLHLTHLTGLFAVAGRVHAVDQVIAGSLRPVALPALRVLLGVLFVWFGGLKIIGRSPVAGLIAQTLPLGDDHLVLVLLGIAESGLGALLISGAILRLALLAVGMHLAGTFATFAMAPALMFSDSNPLLLTADGEFVAKNSVLIAAALVLITHTGRARSIHLSRGPKIRSKHRRQKRPLKAYFRRSELLPGAFMADPGVGEAVACG